MTTNFFPKKLTPVEGTVQSSLRLATPQVSRVLERCLNGQDLTAQEIVHLFQTQANDTKALFLAADFLRSQTLGDVVSYVVNRNINFTNVCIKRCGFCAFSRTAGSLEGYYLPLEEIVRRTLEAQHFGASEVCIQAGLAPGMKGDYYIQLCRAVKEASPRIHIHAFSPEEILYGSKKSQLTIREYLKELKDAGIGSLPGTSAEILDDDLRNRISPGRINTTQWIEVVTTAHSLDIPTSSTLMYGHVETPLHCAKHLILLRDIQRHSGGFTEFVPLSFIHAEAPMFAKSMEGIRGGATEMEVLKMHAVARLVLNQDIPNIQTSWVKQGLKLSQACLKCGANDLGGTLMNESISTAAGSTHGQFVRPRDLRRCIRDIGRIPVLRSTVYDVLCRFDRPEDDPEEPLDRVDVQENTPFGSYHQLIQLDQFRFTSKDTAPF